MEKTTNVEKGWNFKCNKLISILMCSFQHLVLSIMVLFPRGSAPCSYMDTVVKDLSKLGKRSNY